MPKNYLISGAASGIGRCMCRHFLSQGHKVFLLDVNEEELTHATTVHLKPYAGNYDSSLCDLRDVSAIRKTVRKAANFFGGRIDVLINNGGISTPNWKDGATMEDEATMEQWQAFVDVNLTAPFAVSQACIPFMKSAGEDEKQEDAKTKGAGDGRGDDGRDGAGPCIIHVSSFRALQSDPNQEGYAATKAGLLGLVQSMAISLAALGIRVNLVAPGRVKVAHESKEGDEKGAGWEQSEKDVDEHPTNRAGRPEDIVQAAEYLINAGFVTGQDITVDGGKTKMKS